MKTTDKYGFDAILLHQARSGFKMFLLKLPNLFLHKPAAVFSAQKKASQVPEYCAEGNHSKSAPESKHPRFGEKARKNNENLPRQKRSQKRKGFNKCSGKNNKKPPIFEGVGIILEKLNKKLLHRERL